MRSPTTPPASSRSSAMKSVSLPAPHIDFETDPTHDITVQTTDAAGNSYSEVITLTVNDVNEAPTDIALAGGSVDERRGGRHDGRHALHSRCGCGRHPHLCHHQRPLRLLRDRRQRGPGRGRCHISTSRPTRATTSRFRRPIPPAIRLFRGGHAHGQRPDRRKPDRHRR